MLSVWLVCAIFSFFPLILRPMFTNVAETMDIGYWIMVFSDNDVLYLVVAISVVAVGMSILIGKRNSVAVYLIAVLEVVGIFLAMMGYLMLEGDPVLFGETVYKPTIGDKTREIEVQDISRTNKILYATSLTSMLVFTLFYVIIHHIFM